MTTTERERSRCRVCDTEGEFTYLASTNQLEPPDLDTRPGEQLRSTLRWWVQRCPACGYCAPSIAEGPAGAARVVKTRAYQALLARATPDGATTPPLAIEFLCASLVLEHTGALADAGWQALYAAWASDDAQDDETALTCREHALELFERAGTQGQPITEQPAEAHAVLADVLRRCGRFDAARARCETGLAERPDEPITTILQYEAALAAHGDRAAHTTAEAEAWRQQQS
jgi:hypothetical protein